MCSPVCFIRKWRCLSLLTVGETPYLRACLINYSSVWKANWVHVYWALQLFAGGKDLYCGGIWLTGNDQWGLIAGHLTEKRKPFESDCVSVCVAGIAETQTVFIWCFPVTVSQGLIYSVSQHRTIQLFCSRAGHWHAPTHTDTHGHTIQVSWQSHKESAVLNVSILT